MTVLLYGKSNISNGDIDKSFSDYVDSLGSKPYLKKLGTGVRENHPNALYYMGLIFDKHIFVEGNKTIAKNLYEDSIQEYRNANNHTNIVYPLYRLGMIYVGKKKYAKGIQLLKESSDLDFYRSTYALITLYEKEYFNAPKSFTKEKLKIIVQLYQKLLKSKEFYSKALTGLARWYLNSPYDEFINYDLSLKYSLEAANEYHEPEAYANLVTLYGYRDVPFKDINKSYYWKALYRSERFNDR